MFLWSLQFFEAEFTYPILLLFLFELFLKLSKLGLSFFDLVIHSSELKSVTILLLCQFFLHLLTLFEESSNLLLSISFVCIQCSINFSKSIHFHTVAICRSCIFLLLLNSLYLLQIDFILFLDSLIILLILLMHFRFSFLLLLHQLYFLIPHFEFILKSMCLAVHLVAF